MSNRNIVWLGVHLNRLLLDLTQAPAAFRGALMDFLVITSLRHAWLHVLLLLVDSIDLLIQTAKPAFLSVQSTAISMATLSSLLTSVVSVLAVTINCETTAPSDVYQFALLRPVTGLIQMLAIVFISARPATSPLVKQIDCVSLIALSISPTAILTNEFALQFVHSITMLTILHFYAKQSVPAILITMPTTLQAHASLTALKH